MTVVGSLLEDHYEAALAALERDGYALVPGALTPKQVAKLQSAAFEVAANATAPSDSGSGAVRYLGAAYAHPRFTSLACDSRIVALLARALTPNLHVYQSHLDVHPPQQPGNAWRWDAGGGRICADLDVRELLSVRVGYFLTDLEAEGFGNVAVIPGSHRWTEPLPRTPGTEPADAQQVLARAGDALLLDHCVWHARTTNTSGRVRIVACFDYSPRWIAQREKAPPELLEEEAVPLRRQLLGAGDWDTSQVARADLPVSELVELLQ